jgi:hypothetical protein
MLRIAIDRWSCCSWHLIFLFESAYFGGHGTYVCNFGDRFLSASQDKRIGLHETRMPL